MNVDGINVDRMVTNSEQQKMTRVCQFMAFLEFNEAAACSSFFHYNDRKNYKALQFEGKS